MASATRRMLVTSTDHYCRKDFTRSLSPSTPTGLRRHDYELPNGRAVMLDKVFSPDECHAMIAQAEDQGFESLQHEFPEQYRQNSRLLVLSNEFADAIFARIQPLLTAKEVVQVIPVGFGNYGTWLPLRVNECIKFGRYESKQSFQPHVDGPWIPRHDEASVYTLVCYLNDDFEGGTTDFMKEPTKLPESTADAAQLTDVEVRIQPKQGSVLLFTHDSLHQGAPVIKGVKYIFRTEIMYKRKDMFEELDRTADYKETKAYKKAITLYCASHELQQADDPQGFNDTYLKALKLQTEAKRSTSAIMAEEDLQLLPLSHDDWVNIFSKLAVENLVVVMRVCRAWYRVAQDGRLWYKVYKQFYPLVAKLPANLTVQQDWYHALRSRWTIPGQAATLVVDLGSHTYKSKLVFPDCETDIHQDDSCVLIINGVHDIHARRGRYERYWVGAEAKASLSDPSVVSRAVYNGRPAFVAHVAELLSDCFQQARVHPNATSLLVAVPDMSDQECCDCYTRIAQKVFGVPLITLMPACMLTLVHAGMDHGVVVSLGHDVISCAIVGPDSCVHAYKSIERCEGITKTERSVTNYGEMTPATICKPTREHPYPTGADIADLIKTTIADCQHDTSGYTMLVTGGHAHDEILMADFRKACDQALLSFAIRISRDPVTDVVKGGALFASRGDVDNLMEALGDRDPSLYYRDGEDAFYRAATYSRISYWFLRDVAMNAKGSNPRNQRFLVKSLKEDIQRQRIQSYMSDQ
eukprot:TRINITY_DN11660_c1_g5_i2.p1 TRINITY_DN11660_c1_g5~~TRINITY_DN11660_c1_g5_i2.p1  ORF type:complete len:751 (+),score=154.65 TRINITY_DN11660_c1_g5_i2:79-2331(+)